MAGSWKLKTEGLISSLKRFSEFRQWELYFRNSILSIIRAVGGHLHLPAPYLGTMSFVGILLNLSRLCLLVGIGFYFANNWSESYHYFQENAQTIWNTGVGLLVNLLTANPWLLHLAGVGFIAPVVSPYNITFRLVGLCLTVVPTSWRQNAAEWQRLKEGKGSMGIYECTIKQVFYSLAMALSLAVALSVPSIGWPFGLYFLSLSILNNQKKESLKQDLHAQTQVKSEEESPLSPIWGARDVGRISLSQKTELPSSQPKRLMLHLWYTIDALGDEFSSVIRTGKHEASHLLFDPAKSLSP